MTSPCRSVGEGACFSGIFALFLNPGIKMADRRVNSCRLVYVHTVSIQVRVRVLSVSVAGLEVVAVSRSEGDFKNMQTAETEN